MGRNKSFYQACEDGDIATIEDLLAEGFNVNAINPVDGSTGLHYAADSGNLAVVKLLIEKHKAGVDVVGPDGGSPLHWAIRTPNRALIIKCLLDHGADPNLQGRFGRAPIHICANKGLVDNLRALIQYCSKKDIDLDLSDNVSGKKNGTTALHLAAGNGHEECVRALLFEFDIKPQTSVKNGKLQLPIHMACSQSNPEIVKMLVESSADHIEVNASNTNIESVDAEGRIPLFYACLHKNVEVVRYLTDIGKNAPDTNSINVNYATESGETALHCAAAGGTRDIIDLLIAAGADQTCTNVDRLTPLHLACQHGHLLSAETLIANYNADTECKDSHGETPLMMACAHNDSPEIVQMLVENGANYWAHDHSGSTPIFHAVLKNRVEVLRYLMTLMTDNTIEDDVDNSQNTPLHVAAEQGHFMCLEELLGRGYDLSRENKKGKTAVHQAAEEGRKESLEMMVRCCPESVCFEDRVGNTPLHIAAKHGHTHCCRTLISGGADVKRSNMRGMTSLHLGAESGSTSVVRLLVGAGALVSAVDINEDTALHYSARAGEDGTARVLLDSGCDVTRFNQHGENALLTAIRNNNENIIGLLVRCSKWREAVKAQIKPLHKKPPDDAPVDKSMVVLKMLNEGVDEAAQEHIASNPIHQLIIRYPHQASALFDRCTEANDMTPEDKPDYWVAFDYNLVEAEANKAVVHPFTSMLNHDRMELLEHPLVSSLITYKWNSYGEFPCFLNVLLNFLYVVFVTVYALLEVNPLSSESRPKLLLSMAAAVVIFLIFIRLSTEILQAIHNTSAYFRDPLNYLEVIGFLLSLVFVSSIFIYPDADKVHHWQWEIGCYVIVLTWMNLLMSLKKLPYIGIYVIMISILIKTFIGVAFPIFLFVIPFWLLFYMAFGPTFGTYRTLGYSFAKSMTMFTGEVNFDMYFIPPSFSAENPMEYPYSTYFLYLIFLFLCPIILMNLLTGLAIIDVAETRKISKLLRSAERIEQIFLGERLPITKPDLPYPTCRLYPNKLTWRGAFPFDFRGSGIADILSRRRKVESEGDKNLRVIQSKLSRVITSQANLRAKLDVVYTLLEAGAADHSEVQAKKSLILDEE